MSDKIKAFVAIGILAAMAIYAAATYHSDKPRCVEPLQPFYVFNSGWICANMGKK